MHGLTTFCGELLADSTGALVGAMGTNGKEYLLPSVVNGGPDDAPPICLESAGRGVVPAGQTSVDLDDAAVHEGSIVVAQGPGVSHAAPAVGRITVHLAAPAEADTPFVYIVI